MLVKSIEVCVVEGAYEIAANYSKATGRMPTMSTSIGRYLISLQGTSERGAEINWFWPTGLSRELRKRLCWNSSHDAFLTSIARPARLRLP
jgi:hypothetical protein